MNNINIKTLLLIVGIILCGYDGWAQIRQCGTSEYMNQLFQNPTKKAKWEKRQRDFKLYTQNQSTNKAPCSTPVIIPVAVHYQGVNNPDQTCLVTLAEDNIRTLNEDFGGTNPDLSNWINNDSQYFQDVNHGETCIQFCLASFSHPSGYGLSEEQPAVTINATGTADFLDDFSGYLNIFVRGIGVLGYSPLGGSGTGDGVTIDVKAFGSNSVVGCGGVTPTAPFNKGRTLTHEVGHYFNLQHIWGPNPSQCSTDDGVSDTPNSSVQYYNCPNLSSSSCESNDMFMNYMDYVNDACMYVFSAGQSTRMEDYANSTLQGLINTAGTVCGNSDCPDNVVRDGNISGYTEVENYILSPSQGNSATVNPPNSATFNAGTYISLNPGFTAEYGSVFNAFIDGCTDAGNKVEVKQDPVTLRNYPNPFTGQTNIEFVLPQDSPVTLFVSDMAGRKIAMLLDNEAKMEGKHLLTFDGSNYPAGMYYYTIQAGEYLGTQKMILVK